MTPDALREPSRAAVAIRCLCELGTVAGNHGRFLYDFSPDSIVLRLTHDPAPRLLYCFEPRDHARAVDAPMLLARVEHGDIDAAELILGGAFADSPTGMKLRELGAQIGEKPGVKAAAERAISQISDALKTKSNR